MGLRLRRIRQDRRGTDACTSSQVVCTLTDSETTDRGARRALLLKHAKYLLRTQAVHALLGAVAGAFSPHLASAGRRGLISPRIDS